MLSVYREVGKMIYSFNAKEEVLFSQLSPKEQLRYIELGKEVYDYCLSRKI